MLREAVSVSQTGNVQLAWQKRRKRLGDSIPGCLLAIALAIGGSIWGYFQFVHWKPLVKAGNNHRTFPYKKNIPAYLEYGRRFRTGFDFGSKGMVKNNYELVKKFKKGAYKDNPGEFDSESKAFMNQLLDSIQQFDGQEVPDVLEKAHRQVARAHGLCYESILFLREANKAEGAERDRLVKESEKKALEAWKTAHAGVTLFYQIWDRTGT